MGKSPMKKKASASSTRKANKKKMVPRNGARVDRRGLRWALQALLKEKGGRTDLKYEKVTKTHDKVMREVPIENRAGYPLVFPKGSVDPKKWRTIEGKEVIVDFHRAKWLPDDWGQGVKCTNRIARSRGGGGTYTVIVSPDGRVFYHRKAAEEHYGKSFSNELGFQGQVRLAKLKAKEAVQLVRLQIKEIPNRPKGDIRTDAAESLFKLLSPEERKCIPKASEFHFCVVSARRASTVEGVQDIFKVQCQFDEAGVVPTWYVDSDSVKEYRKLGLQAVEGGRLCPSRNKALKDANLLGKICVQASDDISAWEYRHGKRAASRDDALCNAAWAKAKRYVLSPLTAAQFIVAKMRGSCSRTMAGEEFGTKHFILGDVAAKLMLGAPSVRGTLPWMGLSYSKVALNRAMPVKKRADTIWPELDWCFCVYRLPPLGALFTQDGFLVERGDSAHEMFPELEEISEAESRNAANFSADILTDFVALIPPGGTTARHLQKFLVLLKLFCSDALGDILLELVASQVRGFRVAQKIHQLPFITSLTIQVIAINFSFALMINVDLVLGRVREVGVVSLFEAMLDELRSWSSSRYFGRERLQDLGKYTSGFEDIAHVTKTELQFRLLLGVRMGCILCDSICLKLQRLTVADLSESWGLLLRPCQVRFDENLNLKVMRCNRMTLTVKHYSNSGGACSNRDKKGKEEQRNIGILMDKWPRALRFNPKRTNEVIMSWPADDDAEGKHHEKRKPSQRPGAGKPGKTKAVAKKTKVTRPKAHHPSNAVILQTEKSKEANNARIKPYVARRCGRVSGKRVSEVLGRLKYTTAEGETRTYVTSDLSYDLQRGFLKLK
ncbi:unnamed protein product, partial [Symbiodinium sp. KB8]